MDQAQPEILQAEVEEIILRNLQLRRGKRKKREE